MKIEPDSDHVEDAREVRMAQRGGLDNPLTKRATNVLVTPSR